MKRLLIGAAMAGLVAGGVPPAVAADTVTLQRTVTTDWTSGFCADVKVSTSSKKAITWKAAFDPQGTVTSIWSAKLIGTAGDYTVSGLSWNSTISAASPTTFGYCATRTKPAPTPTPTPTPSQTTSPSASPTAGGITVSLVTSTEWTTGRTIDATIQTAGPTSSWTVAFPSTMTVTNMWNATNQSTAGTIKAANAGWNAALPANGTTTFGFTANGPAEVISSCAATVNGTAVSCSVDGGSTGTPAPSTSATPSPTVTPTVSPTVSPTVTPSPTTTPVTPGDVKVIGYYPGWATYERNYQVADIPAAKLTHVNYAFANISGGKCVVGDPYADTDKFFSGDSWDAGALRGNFNQLRKLKAANPHLKTLISVGGWTWSSQFSNAALTAASRKTFADSCVSLMKTYGFDGIDIDWEYPVSGGLQNGRAEDKQNFTLLLQALNLALDTQGASDGREYLLTIAGPAAADKLANIEVLKVAGTVDWINLMTYDYNGNWNSFTGHNAPLSKPTGYPGPAGLYAQATVDAYLATGIPASKLVLGMPFYGRSWSEVGSTNNGLYQSGVTGPGTWEPGMLDYKDIVARYGTAAGYTRYWDASAQVPYLYNKTAGVFVSYDDPQSLQAKAQYAGQKGLGGAMIWELSADTTDRVLLDAVRRGLG